MTTKKPQLIVALDVGTLEEARNIIDILSSVVDIFKVGSQLFTACGPAAVRFIIARGKKVFLDLKYHDIPHAVFSSVSAAITLNFIPGIKDLLAGNPSLFMLTVHTAGGKVMLEAAVKAASEKAKELNVARPYIVGVTVLTSEEKQDNIRRLVLERALLAKEAGCDGVVASGEEAALIRQKLGENFIIVTPGIRSKGEGVDDQKRTATPPEAVAAGSDFLVVGRPIVASNDPLEAAKKILSEINNP
jgi:orotidine-5'-phosphate decarboxylase